MANWWDSAPKAGAFDVALAAEGVDPNIAAIARSIYEQESGSGRNTKTSNAGAVGGMQIIPSTFQQVADKDWNINNPLHNARAGIRYIKQLYQQAGGDPALTAAGYYGGPGGLEKARKGVAVSDPRNPKAPTTLEYGKQVAARVLNAVVPSAQAAEQPKTEWWASAPVVETSKAEPVAKKAEPSAVQNFGAGVRQGIGDLVKGGVQGIVHGIGSVANFIAPDSQMAKDFSAGIPQMDQQLRDQEKAYQAATPGSVAAGFGRVVGNLPGLAIGAGTGAAAAPTLAGRVATGAGAGALSGALAPVLSEEGSYASNKLGQIGTGLATGGALGGLIGGVAKGANAALTPDQEVAALAKRAKQLGIDVRPDQIANNKVVNNVSAALDYVPLSGKAGDLVKQQKQFNTAISKTIGENTDNVAEAVAKAETRLSGEFDKVLKKTTLVADNQFAEDVSRIAQEASSELVDAQARVIAKQIANINSKVSAGGTIDAEAAYNIKKMLDRLAKSNDSSLAYYGKELRNSLMDALNRSLPDGGKEFAKTRQQWGNLMEINKLLPAGAEGNISAARLGNARNIRSKDLSELADIGAQFLKGRVGDSGTAGRAGVYGALAGGTMIDPVSAAGSLAVGRGINSVLGSQALANQMMGGGALGNPLLTNELLGAAAYGLPAAVRNR